jgi:hypothetical protein
VLPLAAAAARLCWDDGRIDKLNKRHGCVGLMADKALFFGAGAALATAVYVCLAYYTKSGLDSRREEYEREIDDTLDFHPHSNAKSQNPYSGTPPRSAATAHSRTGTGIDSAFPTGGASLKPHKGGSTQDLSPQGGGGSVSPKLIAPPVIVGVAGASGSGKTCIAELLVKQLPGVRCVSISSDSYYKGLAPGISASDNNWDHPDALELDLLAQHLNSLRNVRPSAGAARPARLGPSPLILLAPHHFARPHGRTAARPSTPPPQPPLPPLLSHPVSHTATLCAGPRCLRARVRLHHAQAQGSGARNLCERA